MGDEVSFIQSVRAEQFDKLDFTFFASDQDSTRKNWKTARDAGSAIVDLSYALEDEPGASVRSPWVERQLGQTLGARNCNPARAWWRIPPVVLGVAAAARAESWRDSTRSCHRASSPHPNTDRRAWTNCTSRPSTCSRSSNCPRMSSTPRWLSIWSRATDRTPLRRCNRSKQRILKHYQRIAGDGAPHAVDCCCCRRRSSTATRFRFICEMEQVVDVERFSQALAGEHVTITRPGGRCAQQCKCRRARRYPGFAVKPDSNDPNGVWLWAAADNLRIAAATAVECAETMAATRPRGKIQ